MNPLTKMAQGLIGQTKPQPAIADAMVQTVGRLRTAVVP